MQFWLNRKTFSLLSFKDAAAQYLIASGFREAVVCLGSLPIKVRAPLVSAAFKQNWWAPRKEYKETKGAAESVLPLRTSHGSWWILVTLLSCLLRPASVVVPGAKLFQQSSKLASAPQWVFKVQTS